MVSPQWIVVLLVLFSARTFAQSVFPKPLPVYVLPIDTNVKGEFAEATSGIESNLESAFTNKGAFFRVLDRAHENEVLKENNAEKEIEAIGRGVPVSVSLAQLLHARAVVRGELRETADGLVLTVKIRSLDSQVLWVGHVRQSKAEWQLNDVQDKDGRRLAREAAKALWPNDPANAADVDTSDIPKNSTIIPLLNEEPTEAIISKQQNPNAPKPNSSVVGSDKSSTSADRVFESHNIRFEMNSCERSYTTISCTLTMTNVGEDGDIGFQTCNQYPARIQDDAGREFRARAIIIGRNNLEKVCTWRSPSNPYTLVNDTHTRTTVKFEGVSQDTSSLSLFELWIQAGKEGGEQIRIAFHKIPLIQK